MAMFDPHALPAVPAAPPPTVRPLFRPTEPERAMVEPAPIVEPEPVRDPAPVEPVPPPVAAAAPAPSIAVLLDRLDRGLQRRRRDAAPPPTEPSPGLASALGALRRMAGGE
ncbi:hypothetical protein [Sphingomonas hankookensis]